MIESNIIKRYISRFCMQNSEMDIAKIAELSLNVLSNRFLLNESVVIPSMEASGKIIKCNKDSYTVQLQDTNKQEIPFSELKRKNTFNYADIYIFLESITKVTPFGRVVIENVFDKITQPGFGSKAIDNNTETLAYRNSTRKQERQPERPTTVPSVFQTLEIKNQISKAKGEEEQPIELDLNKFNKLLIPEFENENLAILVKIFTFSSSFKQEIPSGNIKIEEFSKLFLDGEYSHEIVVGLHKLFIEAIEKDVSAFGNRFLNELKFSIARLPEFQAEPTKENKKKRISIDKENWKIQIKNFLHNFSLETGQPKIFRFLDIFKKDTLDLRLEFLNFLFILFSYTETFKSLVYSAVNFTRSNKANELSKKGEENSDDGAEQVDTSAFLLDNPLMANIGRFKEYVLFLSDRTIILRDKYNFYIVESKDVKLIMKEMNVQSKTERNTIMNFRSITGELFNKSK